MKVCVLVGARPQFIKAAELVHGGRSEGVEFSVVHTGQHYDREMSDLFFEELQIPEPAVNLGVGSASHGRQTGQMLADLERYLLESGLPDWMVVFGDTNSTLAGVLVASKLGIRVAHVEAGLRSYDRTMPEEINRVVADRIADALFAPSTVAAENLEAEGLGGNVVETGDIMLDSVIRYRSVIEFRSRAIRAERGDGWFLATVHRPASTDHPERLSRVLELFESVGRPVLWPIHPRTLNRIRDAKLSLPSNVEQVPPMGYLSMLAHVLSADKVFTDSGGLQKEAFWLETPCITLRARTEWVETVHLGWNSLVGLDPGAFRRALDKDLPAPAAEPYGSGDAARQMVSHLIMASTT